MLTVRNLTKSYAGKRALNGLSMNMQQGKIIGLLGPNGSGKTTLMKTIAGLLTPDRGEIEYLQEVKEVKEVKEMKEIKEVKEIKEIKRGPQSKVVIAFLPDRSTFPSWMRVSDAFGYFRVMYPDYDHVKAGEMQGILELSPKDRIKNLSKGMQERLALGLIFSRRAPIYLLDEPLGGIDPLSRQKVLQSIISAHTNETTIMLSTHLIKDVETVFDSVLFIKDGAIVYEGESEAIRQQEGKKVEDIYLEVFGGV